MIEKESINTEIKAIPNDVNLGRADASYKEPDDKEDFITANEIKKVKLNNESTQIDGPRETGCNIESSQESSK